MLRHEKFLLTWITICAILLDVIWIALCSNYDSQITFTPLNTAVLFTYALLGAKALLLGYLFIA